MAPRLNFFKWGARETPKGSQVIVQMEIDGSDEKSRVKTAKQVKWILLLKANRAVGCLAWLAAIFWAILGTINGRLIVRKGVAFASEKLGEGKLMLRVIKAFLAITLVVLVVEVVAFLKGWQYFESYQNLDVLHGLEVQGLVHFVYVGWLEFRGWCIVPLLQSLLTFCIVLFVVQSLDRLVLCLGCLYIKVRRIRPVINGEPFNSDDVEGSLSDYPMVLVQIPMCNEREVYELSISAVCQLDWPKERLLIQVLDDSDDKSIQRLIKSEVSKWNQKGINIIYRHRLFRTGYKAGNLNAAMSCDYVKDYEFVAIFDADFQPTPDFLKLTVPHFKGNPELALVQARWDYVNKDENLLTRLQHISTCYHFEVEQQVNGVFLNFFGFNGTAGVWRIKALEDSGGWLERTTVEDMDIAVRAHLNGWKFIYLNDVKVLCEVPESFEAYRKQQYRWHSGPMQLFRLCLPAVIKSKIPIWKKAYLIIFFFLLRKLILPFYSFALSCILLPLTMFIPEVKLPMAVIFYVQILMTASNVLPAPKYIPFLAPYILFENTMLVTKFNAMVSGLFQLGSSYEWIVTKKVGRSSALHHDIDGASVNDVSEFILVTEQKEQSLKPVKKAYKIHRKELALAFLCLFASVRSLSSAHGQHFYYLLFQGLTFLLVGLDLIGQQAN